MPNPTYEFAKKTYADIPALLTALIFDDNSKHDVSHLRSKSIKTALLDELSKEPFNYLGSSVARSNLKRYSALSRLLKTEQRTGNLSKNTQSYIELLNYTTIDTEILSLDRYTRVMALAFSNTEPLDFNRTLKSATFVKNLEDNMYIERALRNMKAGHYARAYFDFTLAIGVIKRLSETQEIDARALHDFDIEISHYRFLCAAILGLYNRAIFEYNKVFEEKVYCGPEQKILASKVALLTDPSDSNPHNETPRYNPLQLLSEVFAEVQSTKIESHESISDSIRRLLTNDKLLNIIKEQYATKPFYKDSFIDFICFSPNGINDHLDTLIPAGEETIKRLYELSRIKKEADRNEQLKSNGLPSNTALTYPNSAFVSYLVACNTPQEYALGYLRNSLFINPYYVNAWTLAMSLATKGTDDEKYFSKEMYRLKLRLNPNDLAAHSSHVNFCSNILQDAEATVAAQIAFVEARIRLGNEDQADLTPYLNHLARDEFILDLLKKDSPPLPAKKFIACFAAVMTDLSEEKQKTASVLLKKRFPSNDPEFGVIIKELLSNAEDTAFTEKQRLNFYILAIKYCMVNDKRTDIKNLLLTNENIIKLFNEEKIFDSQDAINGLLAPFTTKCQVVINEALTQRQQQLEQKPSSPGFFARLFGNNNPDESKKTAVSLNDSENGASRSAGLSS